MTNAATLDDHRTQPRPLVWESPEAFTVGDLRFRCLMGDYYATKTSAEHLVILKNREIIDERIALYRSHDVKRAFEFGIFQGGSVMLLTEALGLERMAAVDFSDPIDALDEIIAQRGLNDRVRLTYNLSQRDQTATEAALAASFKPGEIDLIIDDCSHLYDATKVSFETAFGWLKPGGLYVIEDWGWAHWGGPWQAPDHKWRDREAMSNLIFEIVMATASERHFIQNVQIDPAIVTITKHQRAPVSATPFSLDALVAARGKKLAKI